MGMDAPPSGRASNGGAGFVGGIPCVSTPRDYGPDGRPLALLRLAGRSLGGGRSLVVARDTRPSAGAEAATHARGIGRTALRGCILNRFQFRTAGGRTGSFPVPGEPMISRRWVLFAAALLAGSIPLRAQIPGMWNWWDGPIAQDLNLGEEQKKQIRATVRESRDRLIQLRGAVEAAEAELRDEMDEDKVDSRKTEAAIERVVKSRGE